MNKWKKTALPAVLALALMVPAAAYAAGQTDTGNTTAPKQENTKQAKELDGRQFKFKQEHGKLDGKLGFEALNVNKQKYMTLLAEKYTPDALNEWKTAISERNRLAGQWKELLKNDKFKALLKEQLKESRNQLKESWKKEHDALKQKLESGEITKDQLKEQVRDHFKQIGKDGIGKNALLPALQTNREHAKALTEAIKADDSAAIGKALTQLLDDLKKGNEQFSAKLQELKQKAGL